MPELDDFEFPDLEPDVEQAAKDTYGQSIDTVAGLSPDQLDYLARVDELPDPLTDGLDCGRA